MKLSFQISPLKKSQAFNPAARKLVVLASGDLPKAVRATLPLSLGARYDSEVTRLHEIAGEGALEKSAGKTSEEARHLTLSLTEGGALQVLWLPASLDAFECQEALRDRAQSLFKKKGALEIDISALPLGRQTQVLEWLTSLSVIVGYSPATFGHRSAKKEAKVETVEVGVVSKLSPAAFRLAEVTGRKLGEANNEIRALADLPGNELGPTQYRRKLEAFAKAEKVSLKYMGVPELKKMGAGSFLAVVKADPETDSGLAHLSYKPAGAKKKLVLVGKGLCYDTGGYDVKVGGHMFGMHRDMTGSALAWAVFRLVRELKLKIEVHAVLAIAENLISPTAYRANDVVVAMDGTSIEVVNTDAEGRMVLADALAYAATLEGDLVIDFATLTGAAMRALDTRRAAVFSNRDALARLAVECGEDCGERTWAFPLSRDYRRQLKSDVADILQCSHRNYSDHIYAATFLRHFVGEKSPWLHLDLTPQLNKGGLGLVATDTSGYGARWALNVVRRYLNV